MYSAHVFLSIEGVHTFKTITDILILLSCYVLLCCALCGPFYVPPNIEA